MYEKIRNLIVKLQVLPENQKKIIFFTIIIISALVMATFGIMATRNNISKIGDSIKSMDISQFKIPENQPPNNQEKDFNNTDIVKEINNTIDEIKKENNQNSDWQTYKNEPYDFTINYPKDWGIKNHTTDLDIWLEKEDSKEVASIHIEVVSQTKNIKSAKEGTDYIVSQMKNIIKPEENISIGTYEGYEVIGAICISICKESLNDGYFPFSVIYFSNNDTVIKIKYSEGTLGIGWKNTVKDWKYYEEYKKIISTITFK